MIMLAVVLWPAWGGMAQNTTPEASAIEQSRLFQGQTGLRPETDSSLYEMEAAPSTEGDPDLGAQQILKRKEEYDPFLFTASSQIYYTNNVALVKNGTQSDGYFVNGAALQWKPQIYQGLYGIAGVKQNFYRYMEFDGLDFDSLDTGAGLQYFWQDLGGVSTSARYNYNRLTEATLGREIFRNHQFIIDADKTFAFSRNFFAFANASATFSLSDPYDAQRWDYALLGGLYGKITRHWDAQLNYRIALYDYFTEGRDDLNQSVGVSTSYSLAEWASVGASSSFTLNNSTQPVFDYNAVNVGGGVYVNLKF
jgi:hypothetical protein